jgi:hypothetical protein
MHIGETVQYSQTSSNIWSFVLSAPNTNSYIAIGFSTNGAMVGSSAVVGWVDPSNVGTVKQYHLGGTSPSLVSPDQGSLQFVSGSTAIVSQSSRLYMAFQLQTNQPESRLLYSVGQGGVLPSAPNFALSEHQAKVSTTINYGTGRYIQSFSIPSWHLVWLIFFIFFFLLRQVFVRFFFYDFI